MLPNTNSLVDLLKNRIRQTRKISHEIVNALNHIEEIENADFSDTIEYIQNADYNLEKALKNIGEYETKAIHRVESLFEEKYNNNPLSSNPSLFKKVWDYLAGNE